MTPLLDARGIAIEGRLQPTDLQVGGPALIALIGPNGGGKTSLLRALAGAEHSHGTSLVEGERLAAAPPARRLRLLSFLPASRELAWPIRSRDVIALGLPAPDDRRISELLDMFELALLADRPVDRLSTGERSRVLLARAMAARPRVMLLDEPLSNLDPYWVLRTIELLRDAIARDRCAAILSLHDLAQLEQFDRALLVENGGLVADAEPEALIGSGTLAQAFGIEKAGFGWRIRRSEDRRSSP